MRLRRLFALLTSAAMLHLTVVAGDAACATHGMDAGQESASDAAAPGQAMRMGGHAMSSATGTEGSTVSAAPVATSATPPCEVPTQQHCCDALVGCSVDSAVSDAHEGFLPSVTSATRIVGAHHDAPASFASAPEPPPPKA